jgi:hypothetical protein
MNLGELMTSDFVEGHTPDELVAFLLEFRKNYRILHNKNLHLERKLKNKDLEILEIEDSKIEIKRRNDVLVKYLNRKGGLTWKERISGKINKVNYGT